MNINHAIIVGRVTADPQLRQTQSGQPVTTFSVATNRVWTAKNGKQEEVEFHNVVVWGKLAEIASQHIVKGSLIGVEGRLQTRSWQDKQGVTHKATEIICEKLQLGPRPAGASGQAPLPTAAAADPEAPEDVPTIDIEDDIKAEDLPF